LFTGPLRPTALTTVVPVGVLLLQDVLPQPLVDRVMTYHVVPTRVRPPAHIAEAIGDRRRGRTRREAPQVPDRDLQVEELPVAPAQGLDVETELLIVEALAVVREVVRQFRPRHPATCST
jgi:hypothetical protein